MCVPIVNSFTLLIRVRFVATICFPGLLSAHALQAQPAEMCVCVYVVSYVWDLSQDRAQG